MKTSLQRITTCDFIAIQRQRDGFLGEATAVPRQSHQLVSPNPSHQSARVGGGAGAASSAVSPLTTSPPDGGMDEALRAGLSVGWPSISVIVSTGAVAVYQECCSATG